MAISSWQGDTRRTVIRSALRTFTQLFDKALSLSRRCEPRGRARGYRRSEMAAPRTGSASAPSQHHARAKPPDGSGAQPDAGRHSRRTGRPLALRRRFRPHRRRTGASPPSHHHDEVSYELDHYLAAVIRLRPFRQLRWVGAQAVRRPRVLENKHFCPVGTGVEYGSSLTRLDEDQGKLR
jgi:hypothetical protein